ncbi:MAG: MopE-related protein [Myxococcota bacterium]
MLTLFLLSCQAGTGCSGPSDGGDVGETGGDSGGGDSGGGPDGDRDGWGPADGDCDDADPGRHPGAPEVEANGVDEDCDGLDAGAEPLTGLALDGPWMGARAGFDLAAGDLNGDGFAELVVGAPFNMDGEFAGVALVVPGPLERDANLGDAIWFTGLPEDQYSFAGWAVCVPGDMNGDGLADLAWSVPSARGDDYWAGVVYVEDGPAEVGNYFSEPSRGIAGATLGANLGESLAPAGDVDGDGLADLLVGVPRPAWPDEPELQTLGGALVFLGPIRPGTGEADAELTLVGEALLDRAGETVAAGDFNGDGHADFVVGAPYADTLATRAGMAWVWYGPSSGTVDLVDAGVRLLGEGEGDQAGRTLANAHDLDGDGADELLVGGPLSKVDGDRGGRAWLVHGGAAGTLGLEAADAVFGSAGTYDWTGFGVDGPGDLDADGVPDLLIGAPQQFGGAPYRFARVSLHGGASVGARAPEAASRVWVSPYLGDLVGAAVLGGVDLTGDGAPDIAVGAPYDDHAGTEAGRVYVLSP